MTSFDHLRPFDRLLAQHWPRAQKECLQQLSQRRKHSLRTLGYTMSLHREATSFPWDGTDVFTSSADSAPFQRLDSDPLQSFSVTIDCGEVVDLKGLLEAVGRGVAEVIHAEQLAQLSALVEDAVDKGGLPAHPRHAVALMDHPSVHLIAQPNRLPTWWTDQRVNEVFGGRVHYLEMNDALVYTVSSGALEFHEAISGELVRIGETELAIRCHGGVRTSPGAVVHCYRPADPEIFPAGMRELWEAFGATDSSRFQR